MIGLEPCPFCGGRARMVRNPLGGGMLGGFDLSSLCTVECGECGADAGLRQGEAVAAEAWNRRAERTCRLERIPYEPGCYEGLRCSVCHTVDLDMGEGPYCSGCGARIERGDEA